MAKIGVAVLGATGNVGQKFVLMLADHPWFEIVALAASSRSAGKSYEEAVNWRQNQPVPSSMRRQIVQDSGADFDCPIIFSALGSAVAAEVEPRCAAAGHWVFSNASAYRMELDVPLIVPEVNACHLDLLQQQRRRRGWEGALVTNPNCSTIGLVLPLAPLQQFFGVEAVSVVTLQALSGAGYPGVAALDAVGNVIPQIAGEEAKIESESAKILGNCGSNGVDPAPLTISAQVNRVAVEEGHLLCVSVGFSKPAGPEDVLEAWRSFSGPPQELGLPSAPAPPLLYLDQDDRPQPRRDVETGRGMGVTIGRLRPCPLLSYRFVTLSHNTVRGAAGASVLNAELALSRGLISGVSAPAS